MAGNLATDAATSPHLFAPKLKAEVYIAAAERGWVEMLALFARNLRHGA